MSVGRHRVKRVMRFIILCVLFFPGISLVIHFDEIFDFSPLILFGLFVIASAAGSLVFEMLSKHLGLNR